MFDDACFACGTPVECGQAYCSDECAFQDAGPDISGLSEPSIPSLNPFRSSPSKVEHEHMTSTVTQGGRILPFALHNPHPEFALPIAQYASAYTRKREDIQRKRTSISSSEASSEFSTPSAPPLTDDDDSMSDVEFILDPHPDTELSRHPLSYARRSSTTDTRSTVKPHMPARSAASPTTSASGSARAQSDASTHSQEEHPSRTSSRTRRSRDALALLDDISKMLHANESGLHRHTERARPHSFRIHRRTPNEFDEQVDCSREEDLDASYATLTKLSVAAKAETIRSPKSRRPPTNKRPRASLPAYFNLTKISRPSPGGFSTWNEGASTTYEAGSRPTGPSHKTSATVAYTDMSFSTATLSGSIRTSAATVAQTIRTGNSNSSPSSQISPRYATDGFRPGSPSSEVLVSDDKMVRSGAEAGPQTGDAHPAQMASAYRQASALDALEGSVVDGGCSGTPRGRTRSRSTRPRSRSRSRTRERAQRAHFGGSPGLRNVVPTGYPLTMTSRGRPQTKGTMVDGKSEAEAPSFSRGRRERKQVDDDVDGERLRGVSAQLARLEIDWLDVSDEPESAAPERSPRRRATLLV